MNWQPGATAGAILRAVKEHGVPNTFRPGELAMHYGGPPAVAVGWTLIHDLVGVESELPGYCVRYKDRVIEVRAR